MVDVSKLLLVVDDDALLRRSLTFDLTKAGYRVKTADCAEDALVLAAHEAPDLILLDIGLPGMDGLEAMRRFQSRFPAPIIFLTARRRSFDEVVGLELGASDYITKPFDTDVLLARIKTALRRAEPARPSVRSCPLVVGDLVIDPAGRSVLVAGQPVDLQPRSFDVLYVLASHAGEVVSPETILAEVWGADATVEPQAIYVHVRWLRERLEADPNHPRRLMTVHGVGYKLVAHNPPVDAILKKL